MIIIIASETPITVGSFSYFILHFHAAFNTDSYNTIISTADFLIIRAIDCEIFLSLLMIKNSLANTNSDFFVLLNFNSC